MHRLVLTGLLPVLLVASGEAQNISVITEAEFLSALNADHPAVVERAQAVAMARARVVAASTLENPVLAVEREDPSGPVEKTDWTLSWQLPDSARRLQVGAREKAVEAADAQLSQDLLSLRRAMKKVYAEWAIASAEHEQLRTQAGRIEALAARQRSRAQKGEASGLAAQRLALAAARLRTRVALASVDTTEARTRARSWYPALPRNAEPALPTLPPPPELGGESPLLRAARIGLEATSLEQRAARRFVRSPELVVGWQREDTGLESVDGSILGFGWSVPLFGRNQAAQALAEARIKASRARLETVRRQVEPERAAALATYQALVDAVAEAEETVAGNTRMRRGAEAAFQHGEASLTDLLETLRATTESELAVLELYRAALAAHRELESLTASPVGAHASLQTSEESTP